MRGHQCVINIRKGGKKPRGLFFFLGVYPYPTNEHLDVENSVLNNFLPEVWVEDSDPNKVDLTFVKNLRVHLIDYGGKSSVEQYTNWWIALIKAEPILLMGVDWDNEFNIWRKEDVVS